MKIKNLILVATFAALTAIGAFIKVPIPLVPFTLQYLFCAFAGILLGANLGALSQIVYVGIGLLGLPIFTQGGGPDYIFKPSFGYLLGFIVSAYVIGKLTEKVKKLTFIKVLLPILAGLFFLYLVGVTYLYLIMNLYLHSNKSIEWAVVNGFLIFIIKDLVLSIIIALCSVKIIPVIRRLDR